MNLKPALGAKGVHSQLDAVTFEIAVVVVVPGKDAARSKDGPPASQIARNFRKCVVGVEIDEVNGFGWKLAGCRHFMGHHAPDKNMGVILVVFDKLQVPFLLLGICKIARILVAVFKMFPRVNTPDCV